jgi:hypothetical protein
LAVTQLAAFMTLLDVSIVNVALPSMERGLGAPAGPSASASPAATMDAESVVSTTSCLRRDRRRCRNGLGKLRAHAIEQTFLIRRFDL